MHDVQQAVEVTTASLPKLWASLSLPLDDAAKTFKDIARQIKDGSLSLGSKDISVPLLKLLREKANVQAKMNGLSSLAVLLETMGSTIEPFIMATAENGDTILEAVMDCLAEKDSGIKKKASEVWPIILNITSPLAYRHVLVHGGIFASLENSKKWQSKIAAMAFLEGMIEKHPESICPLMPEIVPTLSTVMWSTKPEVKEAAERALAFACRTIGNQDIEKVLPRIIDCIARPDQVTEVVYALAATTFVKQVEAPTLAITVPLLNRGLNEPITAVKRQCAVIVDNMCKLVENPKDVEQVSTQGTRNYSLNMIIPSLVSARSYAQIGKNN